MMKPIFISLLLTSLLFSASSQACKPGDLGACQSNLDLVNNALAAENAGDDITASKMYALAAKRYKLDVCLVAGRVNYLSASSNAEMTRALRWYISGAERQVADCQYWAATISEELRNAPQAIYWYLRAIDQQHGNAAFQLALMYFSGDLVEQDIPKAKKYFAIAAKYGSDTIKQSAAAALRKLENKQENYKAD